MAYHALRPCRIAGTAYKIGDEVPGEALVTGAAARLIRQRVLAYTADETPVLTAAVTYDGQEFEVAVTQDGLDLVVAVLPGTVDAAAPIIAAAEDADGLILLGALDSRKGVTDAVAARLAELEA